MIPRSPEMSEGGTNPIIPVIRLEGDPERTAQLLRSTLTNVGFFYLEKHGLSEAFLDSVMAQSRKLFDLSLGSKEALKDRVMSRGYTAMEEETLDPARQKKGDTKEGFYIGANIPRDDPRYNPGKLKGPNCWPSPELTKGEMKSQACQEFRSVMEEYYEKLSNIGFRVSQLVARALELDEHHFDGFFKQPMSAIRLLHYAKETSNPQNGIFACGAHSDYGMMTLLLTDQQAGLQIHYKGEWIDVPPRRNAFVVNIGDMLERWSNGLFKSTLHRVLTSGEAERYSIPFFYEPDFDTEVVCLPTTCSAENPAKYPTITSGQYLLSKYNDTHADFSPQE